MTNNAPAAHPSHLRWPAPRVRGPIDATVRVPASKSLTNRYLVLAALADGPSRLRAPLRSRDADLMIGALRSLGARVQELPGDPEHGQGPDLLVHPIDRTRDLGEVAVECGLAGTVMRFVPPLAALVRGSVRFDGDPAARVRPMGSVITALQDLGVPVDDGGTASLPFTLPGTGAVRGGHLVIDASGSSQFVSALLLVAAGFESGLHLEHSGAPVPSLDHVRMTVAVLREAGVEVDDSRPNHWIVRPGPVRAFDVVIEQDLSNAGPFLAAALATGGTVRIPGWPEHTTQVGAAWRSILARMGADVAYDGGTLTVRGGERILGIDLADASELAPTAAALCALADGESRLSGIAHLRGHETDRLAALVTEINNLGGQAEETEDGLLIRGKVAHGGVFRTYEDHRMATAGAIIGLAVDGVEIEDIATTSKTMPDFPRLWQDLAATADTGGPDSPSAADTGADTGATGTAPGTGADRGA